MKRLALCLAVIAGCKTGTSDGARVDLAAQLNVALTSTRGFALVPRVSPTRQSQSSETNDLFAISNDGTLTKVSVTSDPETEATPLAVFDTPKITFFRYKGVQAGEKGLCYLVAARKSDGKLFCVQLAPPSLDVPIYWSYVAADPSSDRVYINGGDVERGGNGLYALDFAGDGAPTQTTVVDYGEGQVRQWVVNSTGDVLANTWSTAGNSTGLRIFRRSGGFQNILATDGDCLFSDATDFYFSDLAMQDQVQKLSKGEPFTKAVYFEDDNSQVGVNTCGNAGLYSAIVKAGGRVFVSYIGQQAMAGVTPYFVELLNDAKTPIRHAVTAFTGGSVKYLYGYTNGLVVLGVDGTGSSGLTRNDLTTDTVLLPAGAYAIDKVAVGSAGDVTFSGRRASDNARIIGTIAAPPAAQDVSIVTQDLAGDVKQLVQIN